MRFQALPAQEYLAQVFVYDPESGILSWNERPRDHFKIERAWKQWNTRWANQPAGIIRDERVKICLDYRSMFAHRIIYKLMTGEDPENDIDHADGNGLNNRWANLRCATRLENLFNKDHYSTQYPKGVHKNGSRWGARIYAEKETYCLGTFDTIPEAYAAYCGAAKILHRAFACLGPRK